jgi:type IV secretion system protein VirB9
MRRLIEITTWMMVGLCLANLSMAEMRPLPAPGEPRIVRFPYDPYQAYRILSRPGAVTDVQLSQDESLTALAVGDTVQWTVAQTQGHVFIKPVLPNLETSATLVTSKRTYQLTLKSVGERQDWYQQVSWSYTDLVIQAKVPETDAAKKEADKTKEALAQTDVVGDDVSKLWFDYRVRGNAPFAPKRVFDDGRQTYLRIEDQELPAAFGRNIDGKLELANYTLRDGYMVIHGIWPEIVLKLGKKTVRVIRRD